MGEEQEGEFNQSVAAAVINAITLVILGFNYLGLLLELLGLSEGTQGC